MSALMMVLVLGIDAEKAMALGPEGPLMEEFWDDVRDVTVFTLSPEGPSMEEFWDNRSALRRL